MPSWGVSFGLARRTDGVFVDDRAMDSTVVNRREAQNTRQPQFTISPIGTIGGRSSSDLQVGFCRGSSTGVTRMDEPSGAGKVHAPRFKAPPDRVKATARGGPKASDMLYLKEQTTYILRGPGFDLTHHFETISLRPCLGVVCSFGSREPPTTTSQHRPRHEIGRCPRSQSLADRAAARRVAPLAVGHGLR